jgi:two-component system, NarL family, nitrate/nitrite response regulator NarL
VSLRVKLIAGDNARRETLGAALRAAAHVLVDDAPDVVLCDGGQSSETEAPVVVLTDRPEGEQAAGVLPREVSAERLDAALRAAAAGLLVRAPEAPASDGFQALEEPALLTPREAEILALVGRGMSNKEVARALGISVHTVKFHLEALFAKLEASSRAEAVAKGLRGRLIEL